MTLDKKKKISHSFDTVAHYTTFHYLKVIIYLFLIPQIILNNKYTINTCTIPINIYYLVILFDKLNYRIY